MPDIVSVQPMDDYLLEVHFSNGHSITLDMKKKIQTARFWQLRDKKLFESAVTDGYSIQWNKFTELYVSEIFDVAQSNCKEVSVEYPEKPPRKPKVGKEPVD